METIQFQLLGVCFAIRSEVLGAIAYTRAFMDAYCSDESLPQATRLIEIEVRPGTMPSSLVGTKVVVHRSGHRYWNITGVLLDGNLHTVWWPSRGLLLQLDKDQTWMEIIVDLSYDMVFLGEAIFHACRGLALYMRDGRSGNLVHASAVNFAGRGVLFMGAASAGKTTMMTEALFRWGARPLANDRVLITQDNHPNVVSWPSYVSYCEGTLLQYELLKHAAYAYKTGAFGYSTQQWNEQLRPVFTKNVKRVYPMRWLTDALSTCYTVRCRLSAIVLTCIDANLSAATLELLDWNTCMEQISEALNMNSFDTHEPSFHPWHGLQLPDNTPSLQDLIDRINAINLPVVRFEAPPWDLAPLKRILNLI